MQSACFCRLWLSLSINANIVSVMLGIIIANSAYAKWAVILNLSRNF